MSLVEFLAAVKSQKPISFAETMAVINDNYHYQPCEFSNGLNAEQLINSAGTNEGSCRIFAFAQLHQLTEQETLHLFGDFYYVDVLDYPEGISHANIRTFMKYGWKGIDFKGNALQVID